MSERFSRWLDERMEAVGVPSRAELARRLGRHPSALYRWEHDQAEIPYDDMVKLARELNVSRLELYQVLGLLPPIDDEELYKLRDLWDRADPETKATLVRNAQWLLQEQDRKRAGAGESNAEPAQDTA